MLRKCKIIDRTHLEMVLSHIAEPPSLFPRRDLVLHWRKSASRPLCLGEYSEPVQAGLGYLRDVSHWRETRSRHQRPLWLGLHLELVLFARQSMLVFELKMRRVIKTGSMGCAASAIRTTFPFVHCLMGGR